MRNHILVTGGAGYVGSHACKALFLAGYLPVAYDSLENGHQAAVLWGPLEVGSILDRNRLDEVLLKYQPTAILHFAAYAYVGESMNKPGDYYLNNVAGSTVLFNAAVSSGINKIIFSSTCSTYGNPVSIPIAEDHPQRPINPYGASKFMVEKILKDFDSAHGLRSVSLRYFNAAGADPEGQIGEAHEPETHIIPLLLKAAAGDAPSFEIFGSDYQTLDGTCVRDFVHVSDLANAHVLALQYLESGGNTCCLNLGAGSGHSVKEIISYVSKVSGRDISIVNGLRRNGDPPFLVANPSLAINTLGWSLKYPHINIQIEHAWKWYINKSY